MMENAFLKLLNVSVSASWIVLTVVLLRPVLKKAPKWISCLLWGIVGLRLVMPVSFESGLSLLPSAQTIPLDIAVSRNPVINSGIPAVNEVLNPLIAESFKPELMASVNPLQVFLQVAGIVWAIGAVAMAVYGAVSWLILRSKVRVSLSCGKGIYLCDNIQTPFILGIIKPKIYIPSGLSEAQVQYVARHEYAHLQRGDHWWKPLGFVLLAVYWFNPFLWLAYILLCRDIEHACDEKAVKDLDTEEKCGYAETLVSCSVQRRMVMACPLAFGEVAVKDRIKAVLNYKKPMFWVVAAAAVGCIVLAVCFLTDPKPCEHTYGSEITLAATCTRAGEETFTCTLCKVSYTEPIAVLEHSYDAGKVVTAATCTAVGSKERTCTDCDDVQTEEIAMVAHTAGMPTFTKEPNCTEKGENSATCSVCQTVFVMEILETNGVHDMKNTVIRAATCADPGEGTNTCTRCDHTESCTYELLSHNYEEYGLAFMATCSSEGSQEMRCTGCGDTYWKTLPKTNDHRWMDMGFYWPDQCMVCGKTRDDDSLRAPESTWIDELYQPPATKTPEDLFPVIRWDPYPN